MRNGRWAFSRIRSERGATIVVAAIAITALLSVVALAIDAGMLLNSKGEAQRAADAAAMAGAQSLIPDPDNADRAEDLAIQFGEMNNVFDEMANILPEDVDVDLANARVTVRVRRENARGNAVPTWFANVFGVSEADVGAVAAAEVGLAGGATCLKPWAIPDAWADPNLNKQYDSGEYYDAEATGWGSAYRDPPGGAVNEMPDGTGNSYFGDRGRIMDIKPGRPDDSVVSGWYFPWDIPQADGSPPTGGDKYRWNIINCNSAIVTLGEEYMVENGGMIGPTQQGVDSLIALDPDATWNAAGDSLDNVAATYGSWEGSPRIFIAPLYDPTAPVEPGKKPIVFNNFIEMFIEGMQGNTVQARFLGYATGVDGGENVPTIPHLQRVILVE